MADSTLIKLKSLQEFEEVAIQKLPERGLGFAVTYITFGDKRTRREMQKAFNRYWLLPNVLTARQPVPSTWTTVLGQPIRIPICIAPTADQAVVAPPDGDILTAQAAAELGTLMIYSSVSNLRIDEFGSKIPPNGLHWAQTYLFKDKRNTLHIVRNAEKYGFKAIVVTVDSPVDYISSSGMGEEVDEQIVPSEMTITISPNVAYLKGKARESRKYSDDELWNPSDGTAYFEAFCAPTWEDLAWLKGQTKLPIVLKGILTAKAAKLAVKAGVDAIIVSCHGGRQLPGVQPPLFALPEVLEAVKGSKIEVYLDGEIRFGSDVVKALALGARAVFIGRPVLWGLAVKRKDGVKRVLQILEDEFKTVLTMCGCSSLQDVDSSLVKLKSLF